MMDLKLKMKKKFFIYKFIKKWIYKYEFTFKEGNLFKQTDT